MKNFAILFALLFGFVPFLSLAQNNPNVTYGAEHMDIPEKGDTTFVYFEGSDIVKKYTCLHNDSLRVVENYVNGDIKKIADHPLEDLKQKTLTKYNKEGHIVLIASYRKGIVDGYFQKFHSNGLPKEKGNFDLMRKVGPWEYYNEKGELVNTEVYE
ncbi:MAG: hypothetical protein HKN39_02670 [Flavobacteriales bacterium]|nr:hypothetical protein [Flavobacteriales bacterium]